MTRRPPPRRSREPQKKTPGGHRASEAVRQLKALHNATETITSTSARKGWNSPGIPRNWRDRLPDPASYYSGQLDKLSRANAAGYGQARCPFHEDGTASLSVNLSDARGGFKCFACGATGDLVAFHMRRRGCDFKTAVLELVRGGA